MRKRKMLKSRSKRKFKLTVELLCMCLLLLCLSFNAKTAHAEANKNATGQQILNSSSLEPITINSDQVITSINQNNFTFTGQTQPFAKVDLFISGESNFKEEFGFADENGNYEIACNLAFFQDGVITVSAYAQDSEGNQSPETQIQLLKDTVADIRVVTQPVGEINEVQPVITLGIEVGGGFEILENDEVITSGSDNFGNDQDVMLTLEPGTHYLTIRVTDYYGNVNDYFMDPITVNPVKVDLKADKIKTNQSVDLQAQVENFFGSIDEMTYRWEQIDGPGILTFGNPSGTDTTVFADKEGTYKVRFTANDTTIGASDDDEITLIWDTSISKPVLNLASCINSENQKSFNINGNAEPNSTIEYAFSDGEAEVKGSVVADNDGMFTAWADLSGLSEGPINLSISVTDQAGNKIDLRSSLTKDSVSPIEPIFNVPEIDYENQSSVSVTGKAEPGSSVILVISDGVNPPLDLGVVAADQNGDFQYENIDVSNLLDGDVEFKIASVDSAGNISNTTKTATKITTLPATINTVEAGENIITNHTATLNGSAESSDGSNITYSWEQISGPGQLTFSSADNSITDVSADMDGEYVVRLTATSDDGIFSFDELLLTWDTLSPEINLNDLDNIINQDNVREFHINGATEAGAIVKISASDGENEIILDNLVADEAGNFDGSLDLSGLADGNIDFRVMSTDSLGNFNEFDRAIIKDTTLPSEPDNLLPDSINLANYNAVTFEGTAEIGSKVNLVIADDAITRDLGLVDVDSEGKFKFENIDLSDFHDGNLLLTFSLTDQAGNQISTNKNIIKDIVLPGESTLVLPETINRDNEDALVISGTAEAGVKVVLTISDGSTTLNYPEITIGEEGNFSFENIDLSGLQDGMITFNIISEDQAGNKSETSQEVLKDTEVHQITIVTVEAGENIITNHTTTLSGSAESSEGSDINYSWEQISGPGQLTFSSADNSITDVSADMDGEYVIRLTAASESGNSASDELTFTWHSAIPEISLSNLSNFINLNNVEQFNFSGATEAGATVQIIASDGENVVISDNLIVDELGNFEGALDLSSLKDGDINFRVISTDSLGNSNEFDQVITKDTTSPSEPDNMLPDSINSENYTTVTLEGSAEIGSKVDLVVSDGVITRDFGWTDVDSEGKFRFENLDLSEFQDGNLVLSYSMKDQAGNTISTDKNIIKDIVLPEAPTLALPETISLDDEAAFNFSGTAETGTKVILSVSDGLATLNFPEITIGADGSFSFENIDLRDLHDGMITFKIISEDQAGNKSETSQEVLKDTEVPQTTTVIAEAGQDIITNHTIELTGSAEVSNNRTVSYRWEKVSGPGVLTFSSPNNCNTDVTADKDGSYIIRLTAVSDDGVSSSDELTLTWHAVKPNFDNISWDNVINPQNQDHYKVSGTTESGTTVQIVATDEQNNSVTSDDLTADEFGYFLSELNLSGIKDGQVVIEIVSTDSLGNTNTISRSVVKNTSKNDTNGTGTTKDDTKSTNDPVQTGTKVTTNTPDPVVTTSTTNTTSNSNSTSNSSNTSSTLPVAGTPIYIYPLLVGLIAFLRQSIKKIVTK